MILGVIARETRNVEIDPYANAFRSDYRVWERKWEIDSLAYPVLLAWAYHAGFDDRRLYTAALHRALAITVRTYECERSHEQCSHYRAPGVATSAGEPAASVGLIWSAFRASDDATRYRYNIPEEMIAVTALHDAAELAREGLRRYCAGRSRAGSGGTRRKCYQALRHH